MLRGLLGLVPPAGTYSSWETAETMGRITLDLGDTALRRVPWEVADWGQVGQRLTLLRRVKALDAERSGPPDLPLTVAIDKCVDGIRFADDWGDGLFDNFTQHARHLGGIVWTQRPEGPAPGEIQHIVYDSSSGESWDEMVSLFEAYGPDSDRKPPLLLILHDISARIPPYLANRLGYRALEQGAGAVLMASLGTLDPWAGGFFPTFYRKVMHNLPLDQSVLAALREARTDASQPLDWMFAAREGGELGVLLTRAVVEGTRTRPLPKGIPWSKTSPSRRERVMAGIQAHVQHSADAWRETMAAEVAQLASISFDAEAHGVEAVVRNRERVREAAAAVERNLEVLGALTTMGPRHVQDSMVRTTNLWLTEGERRIAAGGALVTGQPYTLHLNIASPKDDALLSAQFPFHLLEPFEQEQYALDVTLFSPDTDFQLATRKAVLTVPRVGPSDEVRVQIIPKAAGTRRLRTCISYRNVVLQSVLLEATVLEAGAAVSDGADIAATIDYVASTDLALLDELPQPTLSLFTNQASDGSHWIGVFGTDEPTRGALRKGAVHAFGAGQLVDRAKRLREVLAEIEGQHDYHYEDIPPLSESQLKWREEDLVKLAVAGWRLFDDLFWSYPGGLDTDQLIEFEDKLRTPGRISVARCRGESTTIPWASLYSLPLDTGKQDEIRLCDLFAGQLDANVWSDDGLELVERHDLLDDSPTCRSQAACPLADRQRELVTVCPFGFWGILHEVEQPLQQVTPTPVDRVPEELADPAFNQSSFLLRSRSGRIRMAMGVDRDIPGATEHSDEMPGLAPGGQLDVVCKEDRDDVLGLLKEGEYHLYYFYCHGEVDKGEFKLKLGPTTSPGFIASADLHPRYIRWSNHQPFVVLNGCETMALTPELIHGFLEKLRRLGALGVVGTEIKVWTQLARPLGRMVMQHLLAGRSMGEAFLITRRQLLRQYNPLGLVYTLHAPATLHLHDPEGCGWCAGHSRRVDDAPGENG
ncbi:MAG: hypothetical protein PVI59_17160 [Anaerolineae bacterium]